MVPCLRVSDGREGLYDLVDGVFSAILYPNAIKMSSDGVLTSTYPVASDLTVSIKFITASTSNTSVVFPKGSSSVTTSYRRYKVSGISPLYDDYYYYTT